MSTTEICFARDFLELYNEAECLDNKDATICVIKMFSMVYKNFDKITTEFDPIPEIDINWSVLMTYTYTKMRKWQINPHKVTSDEARLMNYLVRRLQYKFNQLLL
jgi:hypothetical protein